MNRRHLLMGCCAALGAGLFTGLVPAAAGRLSSRFRNPCRGALPPDLAQHDMVLSALQGLDAALATGAVAVKWVPSAMNIDLRDPRSRAFLRTRKTELVFSNYCPTENDNGCTEYLRAPDGEGTTP